MIYRNEGKKSKRYGDLKPECAAEKAKMTVEEFKKAMENILNQECYAD